MTLRKLDALLQRLIRHAAEGRGLLLTCMGLSLLGTLTAAYPVTAIVVPATLLAPRRWWAISAASALGSAMGATLLVAVFHYYGWTMVYDWFPALATDPDWARVMAWAADYGIAALFVIAATPLPQTPALIFFGVSHAHYPGIFGAMLAGKLIKYGAFAWFASRFPERFGDGFGAWVRGGFGSLLARRRGADEGEGGR